MRLSDEDSGKIWKLGVMLAKSEEMQLQIEPGFANVQLMIENQSAQRAIALQIIEVVKEAGKRSEHEHRT